MNITAVKSEVVSGASKATEAVKKAAFWAGRMIKLGFNKLATLVKYCWSKTLPYLKLAYAKTGQFLKTSPGLALVGVLSGIAFGTAAESINNKKWVSVPMRIAAGACFIGSGVAIGLGMAKGFKTPLI
ncbi:MAG: hypothetical protein ACE5GN_02815 [Waddliaceae bacterium]